MDEPKYKRVLLKISGEALAGDKHFGLDFQVMGQVADYKGRSLLVFASNWSIDYTIKRNPGLELSETAQNW